MREGGIVFVSFLDEVVVCLAKIQVYDEKQALYRENFPILQEIMIGRKMFCSSFVDVRYLGRFYSLQFSEELPLWSFTHGPHGFLLYSGPQMLVRKVRFDVHPANRGDK